MYNVQYAVFIFFSFKNTCGYLILSTFVGNYAESNKIFFITQKELFSIMSITIQKKIILLSGDNFVSLTTPFVIKV